MIEAFKRNIDVAAVLANESKNHESQPANLPVTYAGGAEAVAHRFRLLLFTLGGSAGYSRTISRQHSLSFPGRDGLRCVDRNLIRPQPSLA